MLAADMKVITVAGDNLFHIAAVELGDATQWIRIAELNEITDPLLTGVTTLLIPDFDPNAGGGVAAQ
jgi:nucleoid-associated protein YgaU